MAERKMNGKGDKRRPMQVDRKQFEVNWERIFGEPTKREATKGTKPAEEISIETSLPRPGVPGAPNAETA